MITRRKIVIALGASALVSPLSSFAQQPGKVWRVGFLVQCHMEFVDSDYYCGPFTQGMREFGYVVGKNLVIEWRSAEGKSERLPDLAMDLVWLKVDVLVTSATPAAQAGQKATTTIPVVMINVGDPVGTGLVKSLARPGGNSTGLSNMSADLGAKRVEMLHTMVPNVSRVAVLIHPLKASEINILKNIQTAAPRVGVKIQPVEASTPQEIANAFAVMARQHAGRSLCCRTRYFSIRKARSWNSRRSSGCRRYTAFLTT